MPNVKAAYEKYASKGFEVISISTDRKLKPWRAAVEELGMNWVQLLDVDASDIYGIYAIGRTSDLIKVIGELIIVILLYSSQLSIHPYNKNKATIIQITSIKLPPVFHPLNFCL